MSEAGLVRPFSLRGLRLVGVKAPTRPAGLTTYPGLPTALAVVRARRPDRGRVSAGRGGTNRAIARVRGQSYRDLINYDPSYPTRHGRRGPDPAIPESRLRPWRDRHNCRSQLRAATHRTRLRGRLGGEHRLDQLGTGVSSTLGRLRRSLSRKHVGQLSLAVRTPYSIPGDRRHPRRYCILAPVDRAA